MPTQQRAAATNTTPQEQRRSSRLLKHDEATTTAQYKAKACWCALQQRKGCRPKTAIALHLERYCILRSGIMPLKTNWEHLNVPLPPLNYRNTTTAGQGKGSTEWAAHSHTPLGVVVWDDFEDLVTAEGRKPCNHEQRDNIDFAGQLDIVCRYFSPVSREEDVTNRLESILSVFSDKSWNLSGGIEFPQQNQQIIGKPDLIAQKRDDVAFGVGPIKNYISPPPRGKAQWRRDNTSTTISLYRMPFETKPVWKYRFLTTARNIIDEWEIPPNFDAEKMQAQVPLPESWSDRKKKVFHLVRQFYGQLVAEKRRYGVVHLYERFFFCERTSQGILKISRSFEKEETSPSVFQAIRTMVGFDDYILEDVQIHPSSASKAPKKKKSKKDKSNPKPPPLPPSYNDGKRGTGGNGTRSEGGGVMNFAASLHPWDCDVFDYTDSVLLLVTRKDPNVIVKMQSDPRMKHVADEMANEAAIYEALEGNHAAKEVVPCFRGHSHHLGVAMTCLEKELDDFDDIGLENLSVTLKRSAVRAVQLLSEAGVLHNDIALRNIVQSKRDPSCAKIIDFGRASLSSDRKRLAQQVERIKTLLNIDSLRSEL